MKRPESLNLSTDFSLLKSGVSTNGDFTGKSKNSVFATKNLRQQRKEMEWKKNCVYTNPSFDYRRSMRDYNLKYPRPGFIECEDTEYFTQKNNSICSRKSKGSIKDKLDIVGAKNAKLGKDRKRLQIR